MAKQSPIKLGEGSYGCVFKPAFKCKKDISTKINVPNVGKIFFDDTDAFVENNIGDILKTFGKEANKYLIIPIEKCDTRPENNDKIRECNLPKIMLNNKMSPDEKEFLQNRTSFVQQILPYGGVTLQEAIANKNSILLDWLYALMKTFEAIHFLHSKGYAHLDIKINNIVISDNVRLLDFGFMTRLDNIYSNTSYNLPVSGSYRIYPFEFRMYWMWITEQPNTIEDTIDDFLLDYKKLRIKMSVDEIKKDIIPKILDEKLWKEASMKIDVYSVGIMCLNEHALITRFESEYGFNKYIKFLEKILHIDFTKRYSSLQAITKLQKIILDVEEHVSS